MRILTLLVALSAPLSAQTFVSFHGGGADFDLSGVGQTAVFEARMGVFVNRYVSVEGGLGISDVPEQFGDVFYALPSVEVQLGVPIMDSVRPYVGMGIGAFVPLSDPVPGRREVEAPRFELDYDPPTQTTINLGLGLDAGIAPDLFARVSGRLRGTVGDGPDFFTGTFTEVTVGVGVRL
ncbi:outer membrane beta-barrel protein [Rubrivirga sp.]|uniref:outer membrane beta-barrel protein n=1 Tax=Rubrivirga sp. TaxID=1885344 RepID=UPI003C732A9E